ncbi:hypothetical protein GCM10008018_43160 [Paenibacillus marchantiophytorum]|uniref:Uncharacterized protein n=1 Tax=Paenibacillus marchantiophytorum TaxID=1619310 RepID=A0ABQ1EYE1_9BACL|nr:hypothetical protein [Paenibacillus marchantiophytorum]GFZ92249.1 hypothetical protein GCM10008018_43160 [Paenibacillus marchantiophytorum]
MDSTAHGILLEWEDGVQYLHSAEKEWFYLQGVKDGMGMNREMNLYLKNNQSEF